MYSMMPAPEMLARSVRSALTMTLPTPLTETVALLVRKRSALYDPAPEIDTCWSSTRPLNSAESAPEPSTRSVVAVRSSIVRFAPPDAAMRSVDAWNRGTVTFTVPVSSNWSRLRTWIVIVGACAVS